MADMPSKMAPKAATPAKPPGAARRLSPSRQRALRNAEILQRVEEVRIEQHLESERAAAAWIATNESGTRGWPQMEGIRAAVKKARAQQDPNAKLDGHELLTVAEDKALEGMLLAMSQGVAAPSTYQEVADVAVKLMQARVGGGAAGAAAVGGALQSDTAKAAFGRRFVDNHPSLVRLRGKQVTRNRTAFSMADVDSLIEHAQASGDSALKAHQVGNMDECRLLVSGTGDACVMERGARRANLAGTRDQRHAMTYVPVTLASGVTLIEFFVLKGTPCDDKDEDNEFFEVVIPKDKDHSPGPGLRGSVPRRFLISKSGYVNQKLFAMMLEEIGKLWYAQNGGARLLLWIDNCSAHGDHDAIIRSFLEYSVNVRFLVAHTTHFLQPLDGAFFGALKVIMASKQRKVESSAALLGLSASGSTPSAAFGAVNAVHNNAQLIKKSFLQTGLFPFNPDLIKTLAEQNHAAVLAAVAGEEREGLVVGPAVAAARAAAAATIAEARETVAGVPSEDDKKPTRMSARSMYDAEGLTAAKNDASKKRKADEAAKNAKKAEQQKQRSERAQARKKTTAQRKRAAERKEAASCCFKCKTKRHAHGVLCTTCRARWVCKKCNAVGAGARARSAMQDHERRCSVLNQPDDDDDDYDAQDAGRPKRARVREAVLELDV